MELWGLVVKRKIFRIFEEEVELVFLLSRPKTVLVQTKFKTTSFSERGLTKDEKIINKQQVVNGRVIYNYL
jgi:hypothetical protein